MYIEIFFFSPNFSLCVLYERHSARVKGNMAFNRMALEKGGKGGEKGKGEMNVEVEPLPYPPLT